MHLRAVDAAERGHHRAHAAGDGGGVRRQVDRPQGGVAHLSIAAVDGGTPGVVARLPHGAAVPDEVLGRREHAVRGGAERRALQASDLRRKERRQGRILAEALVRAAPALIPGDR